MTKEKGTGILELREANKALVLKYIATGMACVRTELTKLLGLSKMTTTNLVSSLIDENILVEAEQQRTKTIGRNSFVLKLSALAPTILGVYIARDRIEIAVFDYSCVIRSRMLVPIANETEDTLCGKIFEAIDRLLGGETQFPDYIGISAIGPLDSENGIIIAPTNFFGIRDLHIKGLIEKHYGIPAFLFNDSTAAAVAEMLFGTLEEKDNFVYIGICNGIGGGIVSDGNIFGKNQGNFAEIGHVSIDRHGKRCLCGRRGCLEMYAKLPAIDEEIRSRTEFTDVSPQQYEFLCSDERVNEVLVEMAENVSVVMTNLVNTLGTKEFIIGHDGVFIPKKYLGIMQDTVNRDKFSHESSEITVRYSSFGNNAPLFGSAACVLQMIFSGIIEIRRPGKVEKTDSEQ